MTISRPPPSFLRALLGAAALAALLPAALAERADRNKPMNIEADSGRYDDVKQIGIYNGNVVATKGTIIMRAAQIEARQLPDGGQIGIATAAPGKLATFRQKREGVDETIEGEADRIEYDSRADTVRFINHAVVRRYRGAVLADETAGPLIKYDNTAEVFSVDGGTPTAPNAASTPGGRVRTVLTPRDAASAPPAAPAASSPALKSSPELEKTP